MERNLTKRALGLGTLIFLSSVCGACAPAAREGEAPPADEVHAALRLPESSEPGAGSLGDSVVERALVAAALGERFSLDRRLEDLVLVVWVNRGAVEIKGRVPTEGDKDTVVRIAADVPGVRRVIEALEVLDEPPVHRPLPVRTDEELAAAAQRAAALSRRLMGESINVRVRGGVAAVNGVVSTEGERIYAGEVVSQIPGIRGVKNGLLVQPQ